MADLWRILWRIFRLIFWQHFWRTLSDPRHRNHKSLAIANHNFEVASFSRRNRNEIAVLKVFPESQ